MARMYWKVRHAKLNIHWWTLYYLGRVQWYVLYTFGFIVGRIVFGITGVISKFTDMLIRANGHDPKTFRAWMKAGKIKK